MLLGEELARNMLLDWRVIALGETLSTMLKETHYLARSGVTIVEYQSPLLRHLIIINFYCFVLYCSI